MYIDHLISLFDSHSLLRKFLLSPIRHKFKLKPPQSKPSHSKKAAIPLSHKGTVNSIYISALQQFVSNIFQGVLVNLHGNSLFLIFSPDDFPTSENQKQFQRIPGYPCLCLPFCRFFQIIIQQILFRIPLHRFFCQLHKDFPTSLILQQFFLFQQVFHSIPGKTRLLHNLSHTIKTSQTIFLVSFTILISRF